MRGKGSLVDELRDPGTRSAREDGGRPGKEEAVGRVPAKGPRWDCRSVSDDVGSDRRPRGPSSGRRPRGAAGVGRDATRAPCPPRVAGARRGTDPRRDPGARRQTQVASDEWWCGA